MDSDAVFDVRGFPLTRCFHDRSPAAKSKFTFAGGSFTTRLGQSSFAEGIELVRGRRFFCGVGGWSMI